jgi:hypothetical protein
VWAEKALIDHGRQRKMIKKVGEQLPDLMFVKR